jgi:hypothetical protein
MILSEGRRVQKNIFLDIQTIKFCTLECFNQLKTEFELMVYQYAIMVKN